MKTFLNTKNFYILGIGVLLILAFNFIRIGLPNSASGGVTVGNEYEATSTRNSVGTELPTLTVLKTGSGSLGSVVITGAASGIMNFFDATSTDTNTEWATTSLVTFPASTAAGTYVFDINFKKGLLYEIIGTAPTSTPTWR